MAIHSSILAWRNPWTVESGRLQLLGSQRVRHDLATEHTHLSTHQHRSSLDYFMSLHYEALCRGGSRVSRVADWIILSTMWSCWKLHFPESPFFYASRLNVAKSEVL